MPIPVKEIFFTKPRLNRMFVCIFFILLVYVTICFPLVLYTAYISYAHGTIKPSPLPAGRKTYIDPLHSSQIVHIHLLDLSLEQLSEPI